MSLNKGKSQIITYSGWEKYTVFYLINYYCNGSQFMNYVISISGSRLGFLWHDELKRRGRDGASLTRVFWRFCQTRMLVAIFSLLLTMVAGFAGPVSAVQILLPLYVLQIPVMDLWAWSHTRKSQVCPYI